MNWNTQPRLTSASDNFASKLLKNIALANNEAMALWGKATAPNFHEHVVNINQYHHQAFAAAIEKRGYWSFAMPDFPMDILHEVFKHSWTSPLQTDKAHEFPWYLGHVCSMWRAMFLSMRSTFWKRIEIEWCHDNGDSLDEQGMANVAEIVPFFLDCTRGAPFSFTFCAEGCYAEEDIDYDIRPTLVDLINCSEQWEEVSIQLLTTELVFFCAAKGHLSQLKKLKINVEKGPEYEYTCGAIPSMVTDVFEDAPLLKDILLWGFSAWQFKFNWLSLTVITLHRQKNHEETLAILRETINLVELTIRLTAYLNIKRGKLVHLPHLECLSLDDVALLASLDTPSLQRLRISIDIFTSEPGMIPAFIRRCGTKLSTLVMYRGSLRYLKEVLLSTPELDHLAFFDVESCITDVFKWMAGTEAQKVRFNCLHLAWNRHHWPPVSEALYDLIAHQNPPNNERSLRPKGLFFHMPATDQSDVASLESFCRDRGVRFGFVGEIMMPILPWDANIYDY